MRILDKWRDPALGLRLRAWAIDPHNLDVTRSEIQGVIPGDCSVTLGYYSDTRASASICVLNPSFPDGSWIRLTVDDSEGGTEEIGTFCIASSSSEESDRGKVVTYTLQSAIWAISEDRQGFLWVIGEQTRASTALAAACDGCNRAFEIAASFNDFTSGSTVSYDVEDPFSSILFDICSRSNNRMDVDGHGRLVFSAYAAPSERGADWEVDERHERSIVIASGLTEDDGSGEAYGRSIVIWKGQDEGSDEEREVIAQADVDGSHPASFQRRGYLRAIVHSESEMNPSTQDRAAQLARQYLPGDSDSKKTSQRTVMWCPISAGDMLQLTKMDGTSSLWLVQTADCDFGSWTKRLTLKEA